MGKHNHSAKGSGTHPNSQGSAKVKPIDKPMERVRGAIAFVVLNQDAADKLNSAFSAQGAPAVLTQAKIVNISQEEKRLSELAPELFTDFGGLIFIMASGIVLRVIAPLINNKYDDPAVVIMDDQWRHCVSALSGHEGGANWLSYQVAKLTGATPVISTGTETNKKYTLGIGCRRGVEEEQVFQAVQEFLTHWNISPMEIRVAASVDIKRSEEGLTLAMERLGIPMVYYTIGEINSFEGDFTHSEVAMRQLGVKAVSEPCALMAGRNNTLISKKIIIGPVTLALAKEDISWKK